MTTRQFLANAQQFNDTGVVRSYSDGLVGLMPDEEHLYGRHLVPGSRILDLGIGTGRTSPYLAARAGRYVGVDYAPEMIAEARRLHPSLDLRVGDAMKLADFADASFDAIVFSYNGLDCLHPDSGRALALREFRRVLVPGGVLILSRHHPRALLARPVTQGSGLHRVGARAYASALRTRRLVTTRAFWEGTGYVREPVDGGLVLHMATPKRASAELAAHGFRTVEVVGCHARHRTLAARTPWYSYAFTSLPPLT